MWTKRYYARRLYSGFQRALTLLTVATLVLACNSPVTRRSAPNLLESGTTLNTPSEISGRVNVKQAFGKLPLYFVENRGQTDKRVAYYIQGSDKTIYFTPDGLTFALTRPASDVSIPNHKSALRISSGHDDAHERTTTLPYSRWAVKLDFVGANPNVRPVGQDQTEAVISYFKGQPDQWHTGLPTYSRLVYPDLWPGIDLVYYGTVNQLKYEFIVKPGADPAQILLTYRGATDVRLNESGQLDVSTPLGGFTDDVPAAYQDVEGERIPISVAYAIEEPSPLDFLNQRSAIGNQQSYGFHVGAYDSTRSLVLDPAVLIYAGYIGGSGYDYGYDIAVDGVDNAYITGYTNSNETTFPTLGGPDLTFNGNYDAFVAKVNAAGTGLVYAGYIGGSSSDSGYGIAVDGVGNAYITGRTLSDQITFPVTGGLDLTHNGSYDAFVAKVNAAGTGLVYAGYIGGSGDDYGNDIAVDEAWKAYVTGSTTSDQTTFPVVGGPDLTYNGGTSDAFVTKVSANGTQLVYAGYIGGLDDVYGDDGGYGIAVDGAGNAYVTGETASDHTTFPVVGGPDLTFNGYFDAFIAKVNATGTGLVYAGYIGGAGPEKGSSVVVDEDGNAYIAGYTWSTQATFPAVRGPDLTYNGGSDAFVAKVNPTGTELDYAGYIGGSGDDYGNDIAVDEAWKAYVTGSTTSDQTTFPVVGGLDLTFNGLSDAFVVEVSAAGEGLIYAGYIGGNNFDPAFGIAVDGMGNAYITGYTTSDHTAFPVVSGPDLTYNGGGDAFVVKVGADDSTQGKPPIVLVHGFGGLGFGLFSGLGCSEADKTLRKTWAEVDEYFGPLDGLLAQNRPVYFARLVSNPCYTPPLDGNVQWLMEAIDEATSATNQSKVILVAHSMGGLVSRAYIEGDQYRNDVEALFTLGSPHQGVPHDLLTFAANGFTALGDLIFDWGTFCEDRQPGMCDFSVIGMYVFNDYHTLNPTVKYYFLSGDTPTRARNVLGLATDVFFLLQPNDGIVGLDSGEGNSLNVPPTVWLNRYTNDENHNIFGTGALYDWPYFGPRWDLLTFTHSKVYTECLKPVLVDGTQTTCISSVNSVETTNGSSTISRTPFESGTLLPGETATRTVTVEGGLALFTAQWQTGTLTMTLVAPDNQVIDPAYAANNPAVVSYTASANGAAYYLPNALGGEWQMVIQAASVPLTGTAYSTLAGFATDITLEGDTARLWYSPGTTATLTATLGGVPVSAWVTATVFANGITTTISLSPSGGGLYQGVYTVPDAPGYATVQLQATGINTASLPFEREFGFAFQISPDTFILNGSYSDTPHPYPNFSLYQSLTVTVGVDAIVSGTVGLSADLMDGSGNFVAHGLTIQDVTTGTATLALRFEGADIYASQHDGPYTLTNLLLTDQTGAALVAQEAADVYTTAPYLYTDFASPTQLYLPLVRR